MEKDTVNKKRDFGQKLQDFMASYRGKVIMNYAYSWGAAIVIAGTLFKLTHLPGANLMLWIGMGTEVLVFFISAFDLPKRQTETATSGGIVVVGDGTIGSAGGWTNDLPKDTTLLLLKMPHRVLWAFIKEEHSVRSEILAVTVFMKQRITAWARVELSS